MSTPVAQLQRQPNAVAPPQIDDPVITDVINEMEREFSARPPPVVTSTPVATFAAPPQYQQAQQQQQPHYQQAPQYAHMQPPTSPHNSVKDWINTQSAKRALIVAFIAFCIFYPVDTGVLYTKAEFLGRFEPHDRIIRALLLAVLLYVIMTHLNI